MRLMFWNIKWFTDKRIYDISGENVFERLSSGVQSSHNRDHILNNIETAKPDVFIMIEVLCAKGFIGSLAKGEGPNGLLRLLEYLRQINDDWCLVPPLRANDRGIIDGKAYTEAFGVFYRSRVLNFTGPYIWPANKPTAGPKIALPADSGQAADNYPTPWSGYVPEGTNVAGQFQFFVPKKDHNGNIIGKEEIFFTEADKRRPFLTTFQEANASGRTIKIVTVHPKPGGDAKVAMARLSTIQEIASANNQVIVLGGDFNVDYRSTKSLDIEYFSSMKTFYSWKQNFTAPHGPTVIKDVGKATPNSYLGNKAWDNVFTRYDPHTYQVNDPKPTVINRVAGVPNSEYESDMLNPIDEIKEWKAGAEDIIFRSPMNYGHIGWNPGTSDHLALVLDV